MRERETRKGTTKNKKELTAIILCLLLHLGSLVRECLLHDTLQKYSKKHARKSASRSFSLLSFTLVPCVLFKRCPQGATLDRGRPRKVSATETATKKVDVHGNKEMAQRDRQSQSAPKRVRDELVSSC